MPSPTTYLDHNSTTPTRAEVVEAMLPWLTERFGNPSSMHSFGREARVAIDEARVSVAALIGARPREIIFTSGGTESDNWALIGTLQRFVSEGGSAKPHLVVSAAEHEAVLATAERLADSGVCDLSQVRVEPVGVILPASVAEVLTDRTRIVSVMHSNNETGVVQPIAQIAAACRCDLGDRVLHTDAVQSAGKVPLSVSELGVDLMSLSAHKMCGPKGVGALWVRGGNDLPSYHHGGSQERGLRAGTENVAAIVGFGRAAQLAAAGLAEHAALTETLRDSLQARIEFEIPDIVVNGAGVDRLPGTLNVSFAGVDDASLPIGLDLAGIAASSGSACGSGAARPSHVLMAMGVAEPLARASVRFSFGLGNTAADVDRVMAVLPGIVARAREYGTRGP
jgi:cysteine desulfurase